MGQSFILFYRKDGYFVKKGSNGRDFYECKCSLSGSGATTPPQNFQAGDAPQEAGDPQKKTHSLLPPGLICHRVAPDSQSLSGRITAMRFFLPSIICIIS